MLPDHPLKIKICLAVGLEPVFNKCMYIVGADSEAEIPGSPPTTASLSLKEMQPETILQFEEGAQLCPSFLKLCN